MKKAPPRGKTGVRLSEFIYPNAIELITRHALASGPPRDAERSSDAPDVDRELRYLPKPPQAAALFPLPMPALTESMPKTFLLLACIVASLIGTSSSHADDGVDCFLSNNLPNWMKDEACYRANYKSCLRRRELGALFSADCNALLDNPPQPKGTCTLDDHLNNTPGCVPPKVKDQAGD
jgi:hypothetical protein